MSDLFVFLSESDDFASDDAQSLRDGAVYLLVTSSARIAEALKPMAAEIARETGYAVALRRYTSVENLWLTNPNRFKRGTGGESDVRDDRVKSEHRTH